jgi:hypothetical protein
VIVRSVPREAGGFARDKTTSRETELRDKLFPTTSARFLVMQKQFDRAERVELVSAPMNSLTVVLVSQVVVVVD